MSDTKTIIDLASVELAKNLASIAVAIGEGAGVRLWACCHLWTNDGLTAELYDEEIYGLRHELIEHLHELPMGEDIVARDGLFNSLFERSIAAMLGRYEKLAGAQHDHP